MTYMTEGSEKEMHECRQTHMFWLRWKVVRVLVHRLPLGLLDIAIQEEISHPLAGSNKSAEISWMHILANLTCNACNANRRSSVLISCAVTSEGNLPRP